MTRKATDAMRADDRARDLAALRPATLAAGDSIGMRRVCWDWPRLAVECLVPNSLGMRIVQLMMADPEAARCSGCGGCRPRSRSGCAPGRRIYPSAGFRWCYLELFHEMISFDASFREMCCCLHVKAGQRYNDLRRWRSRRKLDPSLQH